MGSGSRPLMWAAGISAGAGLCWWMTPHRWNACPGRSRCLAADRPGKPGRVGSPQDLGQYTPRTAAQRESRTVLGGRAYQAHHVCGAHPVRGVAGTVGGLVRRVLNHGGLRRPLEPEHRPTPIRTPIVEREEAAGSTALSSRESNTVISSPSGFGQVHGVAHCPHHSGRGYIQAVKQLGQG